MKELLDGYRRFRANRWPELRQRYQQLARRGQKPTTLVVACVDARIDPQAVFGAEPGELLVVRNVANIIPPFRPDGGYHGVSAALEFGVRLLGVKRLVVLGHANCDGVKALLEGAPRHASDFINSWMSIAEPALWPIPRPFPPSGIEAYYEQCVVRLSLKNAMSFPWIAERVRSGSLSLHGFRFDIARGELSIVHEAGADLVAP